MGISKEEWKQAFRENIDAEFAEIPLCEEEIEYIFSEMFLSKMNRLVSGQRKWSWKMLQALKNDSIFRLKESYFGMSGPKRVACFLLVALTIISTVAVGAHANRKIPFAFRDHTLIGITTEGMEHMVCLENGTYIFRNTTFQIVYLDLQKDVDISGTIRTADGDVKFHFTGKLYVSEKQELGIEAYVGQIADYEGNFEVKYFEVKNDTSYDASKYFEHHVNKRVLSFTLERNGEMYYFELDMDMLDIAFNAKGITETAPSEIDFSETQKQYFNFLFIK